MTRLDILLARAAGAAMPLPGTQPNIVRNTSEPVAGEGPLDGRIVVLGESLGQDEVRLRRPFVGKSGQKLRNHMRLAGIHPEKCRIENVYPFYPEGDSIDKLNPEVLREWQANTLERLRVCRDATVIVCVGNVSLETCTGLRDITRRRGSVYEWEGKKVIGMIHPAAILHSRGGGGGRYFEKMCRLDWERVKLLSTLHEIHHQYCGCAQQIARTHILPASPEDIVAFRTYADSLIRYIEMSKNPQKVLAIDIETPKIKGKRQILCVSFAFSPEESLIIPWGEMYGICIKQLCQSPCIKVGHNFVSFDRWWLKREGIDVGGEIRDTMCVPGDVEVLTPQGWLRLDAVRDKDTILQSNKYGGLSWAEALPLCIDYKGPVQHISSTSHECVYSSHHRILAEWTSQRIRFVREAAQIAVLKSWRLPAGGLYDGGSKYLTAHEAQLLCAIQADGSYQGQRVYFEFKKVRKQQRLKDICAHISDVILEEHARTESRVRKGTTVYSIKGLCVDRLKALLGAEKCFGYWLLQYSLSTLDVIVREVQYWDGGSPNTRSWTYSSFKPINIACIATIASLTNRNAHIMPNGHLMTIRDRNFVSIRKQHFTEEQWQGKLYCVSVPDGFFLARYKGHIFITGNCINHCLDPASPQSLEFLASRYTFEQWYKSDSKGHDENIIFKDEKSYAAYLRYCGLDACVTIELHNLLWPELARRGLLSFYRKHYEALYDPILDVMSQGVEIDHSYRIDMLEELLTEARQARDRLGEINGTPLFTLGPQRDQEVYDALENKRDASLTSLEEKYGIQAVQISVDRISAKTVSSAQLKTLLYDKLGLPLQTRRRKGSTETPTADAVALRRLRLEYAGSLAVNDRQIVEVLDLAMKHNNVQKLATFFYPNRYDPDDGRFRFTLKLNTETARLASAAAPDGIGGNAQNIPRDKRARRVMLPNLGHVIVEADANQIESRIVFVRTKDAELIRLARDRHADQHSYTAHLITGKPQSTVGKGTDERQAAKSANHAVMRGMRGKTMADTMLKQGIVHSNGMPYEEEECDVILESYYKAFPGILLWQQSMRREVRRAKRLVNRWGRIWNVQYEEMNEDLYRKAYNFLPQSECADLTNQCFAALWPWLKTEHMSSRIMMQEHDSLVMSCLPSEAYNVSVFLRDHLEVKLDYDGVNLSIPVEFKVGKNWGDCVEIGTLPDRETFERLMEEL